MRISAAGLLLLTASMSVGCVSERTVSTAPDARLSQRRLWTSAGRSTDFALAEARGPRRSGRRRLTQRGALETTDSAEREWLQRGKLPV
jgi:hypothetical protein